MEEIFIRTEGKEAFSLENSRKLRMKKAFLNEGVVECHYGELFIRTEGKAAFSAENMRNWRNLTIVLDEIHTSKVRC